jgi:hypothetical protein
MSKKSKHVYDFETYTRLSALEDVNAEEQIYKDVVDVPDENAFQKELQDEIQKGRSRWWDGKPAEDNL